MQTFLKIAITVEDKDSTKCDANCQYLDSFCDECKLFEKRLICEYDNNIWFRCHNCLNQEIKSEDKIKSSKPERKKSTTHKK